MSTVAQCPPQACSLLFCMQCCAGAPHTHLHPPHPIPCASAQKRIHSRQQRLAALHTKALQAM